MRCAIELVVENDIFYRVWRLWDTPKGWAVEEHDTTRWLDKLDNFEFITTQRALDIINGLKQDPRNVSLLCWGLQLEDFDLHTMRGQTWSR
jgi:hypothetical protein